MSVAVRIASILLINLIAKNQSVATMATIVDKSKFVIREEENNDN